MRLLLILIMIIASTPPHSDMYNEKGEYVEYEYYTVSSEEAALNAVIGAVGFLLSEEGRERETIGELYEMTMDKSMDTSKFGTCDNACKEEIRAKVVKEHSSKNIYN